MDDQFLHQLRRDPPAGFATRLKLQLDRPPPPRPSRLRLLLAFAIFGTAFALVSPQARHAFGSLFYQAGGNSQTATDERDLTAAPPAASTGVSGDAVRRRSTPPSRQAAAVAHSPGPLSVASELPRDRQPVMPDAQPNGGVSLGSGSIIAQNATIQTPQMRAEAAIGTRQALFKLISLATLPLASMLEGQAPVDLQVARTSAYRLNELSSMIPEVFSTDTRAFDLKTRSLDLIWPQFGDFESKAQALNLATGELDRAIATRDQTATIAAIRRIEAACGACHNSYRRN